MKRSVVLVGFQGVQALDLVGPFEVFTGATGHLAAQGRPDDGYDVTIAAPGGQPISTGTGWASRRLPSHHALGMCQPSGK